MNVSIDKQSLICYQFVIFCAQYGQTHEAAGTKLTHYRVTELKLVLRTEGWMVGWQMVFSLKTFIFLIKH